MPISIESLVEFLLQEESVSIDYLEKLLTANRMQVTSALKGLEGVKVEGERVIVTSKVWLAISAIKKGARAKAISKNLSWKEFEEEVARIFEEAGFAVEKNFRTFRPNRTETDVLAVRGNVVIAVDCKHWKLSGPGPSSYSIAALNHLERAKKLIKSPDFRAWVFKNALSERNIRIVPVLITLAEKAKGKRSGVLVIPIAYLQEALHQLDEILLDSEVLTIEGSLSSSNKKSLG
ncbi:MAG: restriction endonuclease [Fervidicoccaceae archaeon]